MDWKREERRWYIERQMVINMSYCDYDYDDERMMN
jgi:hypothetical protein